MKDFGAVCLAIACGIFGHTLTHIIDINSLWNLIFVCMSSHALNWLCLWATLPEYVTK